MNNIIEYLWQAVEYSDQSVKILDTLMKKGSDLKWYFYSEKQKKILRKKKENTTIKNFLNAMEQTRNSNSTYAGLLYRLRKDTTIQRSVISNTDLVQSLFSSDSEFIFISTALLKYPHFFRAEFRNEEIPNPNNLKKKFTNKIFIDPFYIQLLTRIQNLNKQQQLESTITTFFPYLQKSIKKIVNDLEKVTLLKSKISKLSIEFVCDLKYPYENQPSFLPYVLWSSQIRFLNDIYLLTFIYQIVPPNNNNTKTKTTTTIIKKKIPLKLLISPIEKFFLRILMKKYFTKRNQKKKKKLNFKFKFKQNVRDAESSYQEILNKWITIESLLYGIITKSQNTVQTLTKKYLKSVKSVLKFYAKVNHTD